ncbi:GNAT family N-acetyltransferase [Streptomyces litchfieldiae]|uniref:GNAT family N-acetyltransferase n=1 Tax=Streptomyces litchfieldiae TaxID=3075543 RepID=A0ABU2MMZ7_9ACTN|nr:GNAT family N-acetyltransferase [Streptomyces sp. DSM 44938]MDT0342777.1 GNAT family N-acetyltransferase [Streptomyces sp. DSM 44938]
MHIELLADRPDLIPGLAALRWDEWGPEPARPRLDDWVAVTAAEAGRAALPVTWVASDDAGTVLGGMGLAPFDPPERRDVSPWIVGAVVRRGRRGEGIGRALFAELERWARAAGHRRLWVATGGPAVAFYQRCGMETESARGATVLTKVLVAER